MFDPKEPQSPQSQLTQNPFPDDSTEDISIQISSSSISSPPISSCVHDFQKINWPATEVIRDRCRCGQSHCQCARSNGPFHCPACQCDAPSLSLSEVKAPDGDGRLQTLWHCHRGCAQPDVTRAIYEGLFPGATALSKSAIVAPQPIVASQPKRATDAIGATSPAAGYANRSSAPHSNYRHKRPAKEPSPKEPPFAFAKDLATCAFKTLRQRGVSPQTQRDFDIENHVGAALIYPAPFLDGGEPAQRGKGLRPDLAKYFWHSGGKIVPDGTGNKVEVFPSLYNHGILTDAAKRNGRPVYLVKSETEVWTMHAANLAALSFLDETIDPAPLLAQLRTAYIDTIHVIFNDDAAGRQNALLIWQAGEAAGIHVKVRLLRGPLGFDLSDLYESVGFNPARLRDAVTELEYVSRGMLGQWRQDIEFELPTPYDANEAGSSDSEGDDGEADGDEEAGFACMDEAGIATLPVPEFAVQGFVIARQVTLLVGQYYTGKSFVALDMCLSISAGIEWNGCRAKTGHTLYVAAEGRDGLAKRIAAWKKHHGIARVPNFRALGHAVPLTDDGQCRRLIHTLQRHSRELGVPAALVVLDTLSKNIGGTEENSASDMSAFLNAAQTICDETGAAVLILHHPNHQGVVRGSTALPANSEGFLMLEGKSGSEVVRLRTPKVRDFGTSEMVLRKIIIALDEMPDEYGAPSTSAVFVRDVKPNPAAPNPANPVRPSNDNLDESWNSDHVSGVAPRKAHRGHSQRRDVESRTRPASSAEEQDVEGGIGHKVDSDHSLSDKEKAALRALLALCQNDSDGGDGANGGGATFREWETAAMDAGVSKATFARARKRLCELGLVGCSEPGKLGGLFVPTLPPQANSATPTGANVPTSFPQGEP